MFIFATAGAYKEINTFGQGDGKKLATVIGAARIHCIFSDASPKSEKVWAFPGKIPARPINILVSNLSGKHMYN